MLELPQSKRKICRVSDCSAFVQQQKQNFEAAQEMRELTVAAGDIDTGSRCRDRDVSIRFVAEAVVPCSTHCHCSYCLITWLWSRAQMSTNPATWQNQSLLSDF